jgi:integrase
VDVGRVELDPKASRQLRALQPEAGRPASSHDRASVQLPTPTGLRIGELAALELGDVRLTQRTGEWSSDRAGATAGAWCH